MATRATYIPSRGWLREKLGTNNGRAFLGWFVLGAWLVVNVWIGIRPSHSKITELTSLPPEAQSYINKMTARYNPSVAARAETQKPQQEPSGTCRDRWRFRLWVSWIFAVPLWVIYTIASFREETLAALHKWIRAVKKRRAQYSNAPGLASGVGVTPATPQPTAGVAPASTPPQATQVGGGISQSVQKFFQGTGKFIIIDALIEFLEIFFRHRLKRLKERP